MKAYLFGRKYLWKLSVGGINGLIIDQKYRYKYPQYIINDKTQQWN